MENRPSVIMAGCVQEPSFSGTNQVKPEILVCADTHPLFNEMVLEKVLRFCKWHHDKESFSSLRLVCKNWDLEVSRSLRKTTAIPITRLHSPYPDGLGWTWDPKIDNSSYFNCPYPETKIFVNIKITGTCQAVNDLQLIRFLSSVGHQIKSLHYISALYCGHQTKFVWDILHSWCPNLEALHLSGILGVSGLLNTFKWEQDFNRVSHWEFNCDKLRTLILSIEDIKPGCEFLECSRDIDTELSDQLLNYVSLLKDIHTDINKTSKMINSIEEFEQLYQFTQIRNESRQNSEEQGSSGCKQYLPKHFLDFGIMGHILREAPIHKLVIEKLEEVSNCENCILFLLHHPSNRRKNLRHLEFRENVHLGDNRLFGQMLYFLKIPLTTLHLDNLLPFEYSLSFIYKFLKNCAESLEHLEFGNYCKPYQIPERTKILRIPLLPKLKSLIIKSNRCFWVNGKLFLANAPNLQKLSILENANEPEDLRNKHVDFFCRILKKEHLTLTNSYKITELQLAGYLCIRNIKNICNKQFCNIVKVDFSEEGASVLEKLLKGMSAEWKLLEDVKLSIGAKQLSTSFREMVRCNLVIRDNISELKSVKFLEITFKYFPNRMHLVLITFEDGFGKMKSLTSLKLTNFQMLLEDKLEIERCTSHIPKVSYSEMDYSTSKPTPDNYDNKNGCFT